MGEEEEVGEGEEEGGAAAGGAPGGGGASGAGAGAGAPSAAAGGGGAARPRAQQNSEASKLKRWKEWLALAEVLLSVPYRGSSASSASASAQGAASGGSGRWPTWESLVALRGSAIAIPLLNKNAHGGVNAVAAGTVQSMCLALGARLRACVRWRAALRDALCPTFCLRGHC